MFGERQRREFDANPRPMRIFDRDTLRYLAVNDAALALYGYSREEFLALSLKNTRHPEEHDDLIASFDRPEGYLIHMGPLRHVKKSGDIIIAEVISQDVLFEGRRARVSLTIDVTERTRVTDLLRQREQEFETLAENLPDPVARFDRAGRYVYLNSAVEQLTGAVRETMLGRTQRELGMPEAIAELFERSLADAMRTGESHTLEFTYPKLDGDRLFEAYHVPEHNANGEIVTVLCVARDITRRKRAENALREGEERFRALAENIREVFWINTPAGDRLIYVSPTYEEIWGRTCESLYRNSRGWMEPIHPDDLPAVRTVQKKMPAGEPTDVEYRIIRPDGSVRWIRDRSYPMKRGDGTSLVCGIAEDITDQKRAEEERVTQAISQRDALVREVHHRIKNHLQGIAGLLRNQTAENPAAADTIEAAIAQLQSVAAVYGLQSELAESGVPLCRVLEAICSSAEGLSAARIERAFTAHAGHVRLAETEAVPVAVALNELVFNAIEHSSPRSGSGSIEVQFVEKKDGADIRIVNRGRLPARFDYALGRGTGTGLELVRTLLGPSGVRLAFGARDGKVEVTLSLQQPLVTPRKAAAAA